MKLYHYVHCPFCVRIRMTLGYLGQEYESIVLAYDDEKTPNELTGTKMLPIMDINGEVFNESLDIIQKLDTQDKLNTQECIKNYQEIEVVLNKLGSDIHSLAMPYFIWTPEFNAASREYFQTKKEIKRGPFKELVRKRAQFIDSLNTTLKETNLIFNKNVTKDNIDLNDILYASHLWAMYIVPEFQFSDHVHQWLQDVAKVCNFEYHKPYWSD